MPTATNVATPTIDLEDAPSPSLDFIVVDFAMLVTTDFPTFESYVCQSRCVRILLLVCKDVSMSIR